MTAATNFTDQATTGPQPSTDQLGAGRPRWAVWALAAICVLAAVLYGWDLWGGSWGNTFYTAAIRSMSENVTNFLFGSFDPAGVVTVDKPPLGLWPQVISVWLFGFHGWSVLLPQVIEGVATVFLLHRTVRLWAGEQVALLAALIMALTPITVAIDFVNNPDSMLVLWLVASAYALTRAVRAVEPAQRTRWLLLCAFLIGCGFVTKMLAAWIVVPGFAVAYFFGVPAGWRRRVGDLAAATGVLLASSFWWPLLHDLWPGGKPYMDNSTNGTALNLIFDYNGFGRIFGQGLGRGAGGGTAQPARDVPAAFAGFAGRFGGGTGLGRMFSASVGGQIAWLIPLSLLVIAVVVVAGVVRLRARGAVRHMDRAMWLMWGGWLIVMAVVFSYAKGIFHSYYTTALAPAIAALSAAGLAMFWRHYRAPNGMSWVLLPIGTALTAAWSYVLVSRDSDWYGWAAPTVAVVGALAVLALVVARLAGGMAKGLARAGLVLTGVAVLLAPAVWSAGTAFASTRATSSGAMAQAGPAGGSDGFAAFTGGRDGFGQRDFSERGFGDFGRGGFGGFGGGRGSATLSAQQRQILDYVTRNAPNARIKLAVEGGATQAAPWIIDSDATVIGMGGFAGSDNAPTVAQLSQWSATGQLGYVLGGGGRGFGGFFGGGTGGTGATDYATQRDQWVAQHCAVVSPSAYGGSSGGGFGGTQTLYRCAG